MWYPHLLPPSVSSFSTSHQVFFPPPLCFDCWLEEKEGKRKKKKRLLSLLICVPHTHTHIQCFPFPVIPEMKLTSSRRLFFFFSARPRVENLKQTGTLFSQNVSNTLSEVHRWEMESRRRRTCEIHSDTRHIWKRERKAHMWRRTRKQKGKKYKAHRGRRENKK